MLRPVARLLFLALLTGLTAACGDNPTSPTSTTPAVTTEVYTGVLTAGGSGFYSFTVTAAGTATVTFASLTNTSTGRPLDLAMGLGVGVPAGEGCNVSTSATASPGLSAQVSMAVSPGVYCAQFSDVGNLKVSAAFGVRIVHP